MLGTSNDDTRNSMIPEEGLDVLVLPAAYFSFMVYSIERWISRLFFAEQHGFE